MQHKGFPSDRTRRKHFQIRRVPLRPAPQRTPQLYALDVHSICLPSRRQANPISMAQSQHSYEEAVDPSQLMTSAYHELYQQYRLLKEKNMEERGQLHEEIQEIDKKLGVEEQKKKRLQTLREGLYEEIEELRESLNEVRDSNYNLRWEIYHQRGAHFMNVNGYSFLQGPDMTYEELLQMEEQIGSVPRGLNEQELAGIEVVNFEGSDTQTCCICFDQVVKGQEVALIKCKHVHHWQCLRDWLVKQKLCPICKQQISPQIEEST